ncbi:MULTISPECIES: GtrA family protein [Thermoanaerobacterium]|uniref:GtrA family protein n=2 Tax=Thermoanaerobacterium TaxID=28895 RepID=W9EEP3_9THEO|nr:MULTISPECIES: GtrA family protein [Thermoanaerobacterium]ETO39450.1 GtrA family protein [Thermoanaerobacterium aotearoense SCUT27]
MMERQEKGWNNKAGFVQFIKFNLVGIVNTLVDFSVFTVLTFFGMYYMAAQVISYSCGVVNSFIMNKYWTFGDKSTPHGYEVFKFIAVNGVSLAVSLSILYPLKPILGVISAKVIATLFSMMINFVGSKLWVFKKA